MIVLDFFSFSCFHSLKQIMINRECLELKHHKYLHQCVCIQLHTNYKIGRKNLFLQHQGRYFVVLRKCCKAAGFATHYHRGNRGWHKRLMTFVNILQPCEVLFQIVSLSLREAGILFHHHHFQMVWSI